MRKPGSVESLEKLGRVRLSKSFFMRDFLYSEIANFFGMPNIPDNPDIAIEAGTKLCETILEPLQERFGRVSIRSAYRSPTVNARGVGRYNCAANSANYAAHIWDYRDAKGHMGATACVVVNAFIPYYERTGDWEAMAWWVHDHLNADITFFPKLAAFNVSYYEGERSGIYSEAPPRRGWLSKPGETSWNHRHDDDYAAMLKEVDERR